MLGVHSPLLGQVGKPLGLLTQLHAYPKTLSVKTLERIAIRTM